MIKISIQALPEVGAKKIGILHIMIDVITIINELCPHLPYHYRFSVHSEGSMQEYH